MVERCLSHILAPFLVDIADGEIEVYNEFSLQHELGHYLRREWPHARVQFERPVSYFGAAKTGFTKREIDIAVFDPTTRRPVLAMELKFPRNGQHPEQMYSFCKDIAFCEELRRLGFERAALLVLVDDPVFYKGTASGIYRFFRGGVPLTGQVTKPTGLKDTAVTLCGTYRIEWQPLDGARRYALVEALAGDVAAGGAR